MLYVECLPDETLARRVTGLPKREIIHQIKGKYEVLERLALRSNSVALVDEDPTSNQPRYLVQMQLREEYAQLELQVRADEARGNSVVILRPRLEEWLVEAAHRENIRLSESRYNLPDDAKQLKKVINRDLRKLDRLIDDLLTAQSPRILKLRELLTQ